MTENKGSRQVRPFLEELLGELQLLTPVHSETNHIFGRTRGERQYMGIKYKTYPSGEGKFFAVYSDKSNEGIEFPEAIIDYSHPLYSLFEKAFKKLQRKAGVKRK